MLATNGMTAVVDAAAATCPSSDPCVGIVCPASSQCRRASICSDGVCLAPENIADGTECDQSRPMGLFVVVALVAIATVVFVVRNRTTGALDTQHRSLENPIQAFSQQQVEHQHHHQEQVPSQIEQPDDLTTMPTGLYVPIQEAANPIAGAFSVVATSTYQVLEPANCRQGADPSSPFVCTLPTGAIVECLEKQTLASGQERIRCKDGWVSIVASDGSLLLRPVNHWEVVKKALLKADRALDSHVIGELERGEIIENLETGHDGDIVRIRCDRGWTSVTSRSGNELLRPVKQSAEGLSTDYPINESLMTGSKSISMSATGVVSLAFPQQQAQHQNQHQEQTWEQTPSQMEQSATSTISATTAAIIVPPTAETDAESFLQQINLRMYLPGMQELGVTKLDDMVDLQEGDLVTLGMRPL